MSLSPPDIKFSNLEKVFFPASGFTKGDMIRYYLAVAPYLLPHLRDRPVTLIRYPDGISGTKFYEKNAPAYAPQWIVTSPVARKGGGTTNYMVIQDARTLAWCANQAAIEFHPFLHRLGAPERPTHVVFDLDPGEGANLLTCARVALLLHELLAKLSLKAFPKVSGSKGLQLYVPLNTQVTYAATGLFAKAVAEYLEQHHSDLVVSRMTKIRRRNKVLIDWSQNSPSKTTVAVYSLRGKSERPLVSMPVSWQDLQRAARARRPSSLLFPPETALKQLKKQGDLFAPILKLKQNLPKGFLSSSNPVPGAAKHSPKRGASKASSVSAMPRRGKPPASLALYAAKRDFTQSAEPKPAAPHRTSPHRPGRASRPAKSANHFVIQKHAASHLHYDFRLEMNGTLKSWAVPKGLPTEPGVKRAAFAVEDHPLDYMKFEGVIPKGQYGGGTVMVWDIGTYELLGGSDLHSGQLKLNLAGKKLNGEWHLFRIRTENGKETWLIVKSGRPSRPISIRQNDRSVLSGRSMARIASDRDAVWESGDAVRVR